MATPVTKELWRKFCAYEPADESTKPILGVEEIRRLPASELAAYNDKRIDYINQERVFPTRDIRAVLALSRRFLRASRVEKFVARRGISVSGDPRIGKSTAVQAAGKRLEAQLRRDNRRETDSSYIPVVYTSVAAATTPTKLWLLLADFVGAGEMRGRSTDERLMNLAHLLRDLGTRFVIIDEVQRLRTDESDGSAVADALKTFAEYLDATMIYAGISLSTAPLFTGTTGAQWRARTVPIFMNRYDIKKDADIQEWRQLIGAFERLLPLPLHEEGMLSKNYEYLLHRTGGSIAFLGDLLTDAATDAIDSGEEAITLELLDQVPVSTEDRRVDIN